jgi:hypothetical protein
MRLPEEKVKQAILDPDAEVRERAVWYFSDSFSEDATLFPLVIEAVERYGREGSYHLVGSCTQLVHTEESISWVVDELDREDADQYENYAFNLTRVLCHADPALLVHRDSQIIESRHFFAGLRDSFLERIEMLSWDDATCWRELEAVCAPTQGDRSMFSAYGLLAPGGFWPKNGPVPGLIVNGYAARQAAANSPPRGRIAHVSADSTMPAHCWNVS